MTHVPSALQLGQVSAVPASFQPIAQLCCTLICLPHRSHISCSHCPASPEVFVGISTSWLQLDWRSNSLFNICCSVSAMCPKWDSNPQLPDFESGSSAIWDIRASVGSGVKSPTREPPFTRDISHGHPLHYLLVLVTSEYTHAIGIIIRDRCTTMETIPELKLTRLIRRASKAVVLHTQGRNLNVHEIVLAYYVMT